VIARKKPGSRRKKAASARAPVTRERALRTALALADAHGLGAVTMRRLAEELGVEAMSLYHHVPNKDAILDGMVDLVFEEIERPRPDLEWKSALRRRTKSVREVLIRHPWALRILETRTSPGASTLAHHDAMLGCLRAAGFSVPLAGHAYALLDSFIFGFVHTELALPFRTTEETHEVAGAIFDALPPGAFPHLVELTREHVLQPGYAFANELDFGLELILEGLERALARERDAMPRA
jgi:AcrR family transcriptional regulator